MAQEIQMDEAVLSRIINGFRKPSAEQKRIIANYLGADEEWLFAHDDPVQNVPRLGERNRVAGSKDGAGKNPDGVFGERGD
ncbi:MAG TPA: helix-turn-helix transcriptional regulator [Terriglobia bacterium]|nr:helix-turn-helix transcriptional regulator [Terriglobia bacterium]